ncbi:beta-xylosidase/alpha-l-arabinosidase [Microbacterium murale]|uniref:Beta-glucosidase-like glycosyl hydrolase n=1 Tax=Microbacterium murale TaxID=1081040 RepID=A0ABU0PBM8_9MICO|nr:glycoside hydrolase family 3 N-terminal domain-containing protein [Microbacterium murale]MDQ0644750.1 beta-glucosidase-like glycosyl hydrolase [Microbacterium murale]
MEERSVTDAGAGVPAMPEVSDRVRALHAQMTLDEKLAQIVGYWLDQNGVVAPMQSEMAAGQPDAGHLEDVTRNGLGQYTRVYGTRPVDPTERAAWLWAEQRRLKRETRLGIPALVHEECLTGLAAWKAAAFPTPLAWGASFNPDLVHEMAASIGESMRELGIHQGLAPVLDVIRDPRWGRVDECIAEDPYVVGVLGTSYVTGLQSAGVHATLKHFVGYSGSRAGRNHAPVSAGPREIADVFLPPFEMALFDGGARSVMNSYAEIDGVPLGSSEEYLTDLLRGRWGFDGVVVADYFAVAFLEVMHAIAADRGGAAAAALTAGIDVELPTGDAYLAPLAERIRAGEFDEVYVDRAVLRALAQKEELGLLEPGAFEDEPPTHIDLDSPRHRDIARRLAEQSVVLLSNDGILPLAESTVTPSRIAVIGPNAHRAEALMGCYSFVNHVLAHHPEFEIGFEIPTFLEAFEAEAGEGTDVVYAKGADVEGDDRAGFEEAVAAATDADVAIVVVGDQAGLFGRGTVGEGNDSETLELPGVQRELVESIVATGTPVVMIALTGRPYAIGWALDGEHRPAAVLQTFFPGEEGAAALSGVLSGRVNPSGRLPVSLPRAAGAQPYTYLHPRLGGASDVTATDPTPVRPFGFGLSYSRVAYGDLVVDSEVTAGEAFAAAIEVTNTGSRTVDDVVQLYGRDVVASVTRPLAQLLAFQRVTLEPGQSATVTFTVPTQRFAFSDRTMTRVVEPGDVQVWVGADAAATEGAGNATARSTLTVTGAVHVLTTADPRLATAEVMVSEASASDSATAEMISSSGAGML